MSNLVLIPQEVGPMNSVGLTPGYGMVRFQRTDTNGKIIERVQYMPYLWDALRASKRSSRQKQIIKKWMGRG